MRKTSCKQSSVGLSTLVYPELEAQGAGCFLSAQALSSAAWYSPLLAAMAGLLFTLTLQGLTAEGGSSQKGTVIRFV